MKTRFRHRHRVGLVARVFDGLLNERVQVLGFHAVIAQLRVEAKASAELDNKLNRAVVGLRIGGVRQVEAAGEADPAVKTGLARGAEFHPGNQTERIGKTVVHAANRRQRVCHRMDDTKVLLECHRARSEEHTSELQSHHDLVCRLLLEKKKKKTKDPQLQKKKTTTTNNQITQNTL